MLLLLAKYLYTWSEPDPNLWLLSSKVIFTHEGNAFSQFFSGAIFIVVNNQFYKDTEIAPHFLEEHENWMNNQLAHAERMNYRHCFMLQHIPWFHDDPNEAEDYFNIEPAKRIELLERFKKAGIKHAFAGHYHKNAGGHYGDFEMIVTSAIGCQIGDDLSGMRIVRVFENKIDHKYYDFDNFPQFVPLDENTALP